MEGLAWRRLMLAAVVLALALRIAFGLLYWVGKPLTHDEREYLALAGSLAVGQGFSYGEEHRSGTAPQFARAPGYPMLLAAIGAGGTNIGSTPLRVKIVQSLIGAGIVWLIGAVATRVAGARTGACAAIIAAVYPPLVWFPSYVLSETLYSFVAFATVAVLQKGVDDAARERSVRAGGPLALAAGGLAGAAILVRPAMLLFLPLAVLWLVLRRMPVLALALLAGTIAVVAPWTARNYRVHGRFVLVASEGGVTFWTGNHPLARGEGDMAANPDIKRAEVAFREAHPGLDAEDLEPLYYRDALGYIADNPGWWLGLVARKAFYTIVPAGPSYALHSVRYRVTTTVSYMLVLLLAAVGFPRFWRSARRPTALLLLTASSILVCLIFFPQERFRVPVLDPFLIVCAASIRASTSELS